MTNNLFSTNNHEARGSSSTKQRGRLSPIQWTVLILMSGMLLAICAAISLVLRYGRVGDSVDALATALAGPTATATPPGLVPDAVIAPGELYWPPEPQPLATPNAPNDLLWWDARFAYRCPILIDLASSDLPAGTWAQLLFDGEGAQRAGKMRVDGADLRVAVWDGLHWWEIPRRAWPRLEKRGWKVLFHLQDEEIAHSGSYYVYYGNPSAKPPPLAETAPESSRLLLSLGEEEGIEWGPEIVWTANSTTTQRLVSPDGRVIIECPPGGPAADVRVRLRTVPLREGEGHNPLPDFELHADPPPGLSDSSSVTLWTPPLTITINWAGLPTSARELASRVHFAYDENKGVWYSIPVEFDGQKGLTRLTTDQP